MCVCLREHQSTCVLINVHQIFGCLRSYKFVYEFLCFLGTFGDFDMSAVSSQGAVDLSYQLHVVEKRVEAVEVREADLVRRAATRNLDKDGDTYFNMQ